MASHLLINEPPLQVCPILARELGLNEAIVLQQIHYWLNLQFSRQHFDDGYWVPYIPEQWERQFSFWDQKTLHRTINKLERLEVVIAEVREPSKEKYYRIDYRALGQVTFTSNSEPITHPLPIYVPANFDDISFDEAKGSN